MQTIDQKAQEKKWHNKRKLFDDSGSDEDEDAEDNTVQNHQNLNSKGQMSNVVK